MIFLSRISKVVPLLYAGKMGKFTAVFVKLSEDVDHRSLLKSAEF